MSAESELEMQARADQEARKAAGRVEVGDSVRLDDGRVGLLTMTNRDEGVDLAAVELPDGTTVADIPIASLRFA